MRKRKKPEDVLKVTSFRLPQDVKDFLRKHAEAADRTMSWTLIEYLRRWQKYEAEEAQQPGRKK